MSKAKQVLSSIPYFQELDPVMLEARANLGEIAQ